MEVLDSTGAAAEVVITAEVGVTVIVGNSLVGVVVATEVWRVVAGATEAVLFIAETELSVLTIAVR